MKKLSFLVTVLIVVSMVSISALAVTAPADPQQTVESNITADAKADLGASQADAKADIVKKEDAKAFKGKFAGLLAQLNTLRTECKANWEQIKGLNTSIKNQWTTVKTVLSGKKKADARKISAEIKSKLESARAQVKVIHNDIKSLRDLKTAEWTSYRSAVKAKDEAKATAAMNNIISLKKQIIEKQKVLIPLKNDILTILKSYSA
ncbi:MAG TPA: hypothetical protein VHT34_14210 [Clostridia bacterium]|nr:hypothetical protein [Clostridia bacterium]